MRNDSTGTITFRVNIRNRPIMTGDMRVLVYINSDKNRATGDPDSNGAEYVAELGPGSGSFFGWNGGGYVLSKSQTSFRYGYTNGVGTIRINAADLHTSAFSFNVIAASEVEGDGAGIPDLTPAKKDAAPNFGNGTLPLQPLDHGLLRGDRRLNTLRADLQCRDADRRTSAGRKQPQLLEARAEPAR